MIYSLSKLAGRDDASRQVYEDYCLENNVAYKRCRVRARHKNYRHLRTLTEHPARRVPTYSWLIESNGLDGLDGYFYISSSASGANNRHHSVTSKRPELSWDLKWSPPWEQLETVRPLVEAYILRMTSSSGS